MSFELCWFFVERIQIQKIERDSQDQRIVRVIFFLRDLHGETDFENTPRASDLMQSYKQVSYILRVFFCLVFGRGNFILAIILVLVF